ncbi:hypothetical protein MRX96_037921 [Rhipicephalus microplus]
MKSRPMKLVPPAIGASSATPAYGVSPEGDSVLATTQNPTGQEATRGGARAEPTTAAQAHTCPRDKLQVRVRMAMQPHRSRRPPQSQLGTRRNQALGFRLERVSWKMQYPGSVQADLPHRECPENVMTREFE